MHREIPQHADVRLEEAEVHARGIVIVQIAKLAVADHLANARDRTRIDKGVIDQENAIPRAGFVRKLLCLLR
jgi:hypothetical protein